MAFLAVGYRSIPQMVVCEYLRLVCFLWCNDICFLFLLSQTDRGTVILNSIAVMNGLDKRINMFWFDTGTTMTNIRLSTFEGITATNKYRLVHNHRTNECIENEGWNYEFEFYWVLYGMNSFKLILIFIWPRQQCLSLISYLEMTDKGTLVEPLALRVLWINLELEKCLR